MKFKNITEKDLSFNVNGKWVIVRPGKVVELTRNGLNVAGLEKVDETNVFGYNFDKMSEEELKTYATKNLELGKKVKTMNKSKLIEVFGAYCHEEVGK